MSFRTGFHKGKLGIGLATSMGMDDGTGNPRYPLDINGDIRLTGAIVDASGNPIEMMAQQRSFPEAISTEDIDIGDGTAFFESNVKITGDLDFTGTLKQNGTAFGGGKFEDAATSGHIYYNGGNVGIGTTSPDAKLEVNGDLNIEATNDNWNTSVGKGLYLRFYGGTVNKGYIQSIDRSNSDEEFPLLFYASTYTFNSGNVGIGTTDPKDQLHVYKNSSVNWAGRGIFGNDTTVALIGVYNNKAYVGAHNAALNAWEDVCIGLGGNVGIGDDTPSYKLDVNGDINFTGNLRKNGTIYGDGGGGGGGSCDDWCCEVEWNTGNAGGTRQVKVNGVQLSTGVNSVCAIYLNKDGTYKGVSTGQYLWPGHSTRWNDLADDVNNQDNGTVVIIVSADWICNPASGGSAETLFKSIGSYEATRNVIPSDRVGFICCFIKGNYGCIEKCGDDSSYHNGKVFFTYYNLLNITNGLYNYSTTESPDIQGTNPFFGDVRACHGQMHMGYNLGGTSLVGFQSLGTTSSSLYTRGFQFLNANNNTMMTILHYGTNYTKARVGINIVDPKYPLVVDGYEYPYVIDDFGTQPYILADKFKAAYGWNGGNTAHTFSAKFVYSIAVMGSYIVLASDGRIKKNVVDVPDNLSLELLRKIPVRYYEYIDGIRRGRNKVIGFIAQEVKEQYDEAVSLRPEIIPNEYRVLNNISWDEIKDASGNITLGFQLISDIEDVSGAKYKFLVSNDPNGKDEVEKEITIDSSNRIIFEEKWNNVFCYGKEVDDFHTLDKNKLFTINFSATQELDRQQQADKIRIADLEAKNTALENTVQTLISRITALENNSTN